MRCQPLGLLLDLRAELLLAKTTWRAWHHQHSQLERVSSMWRQLWCLCLPPWMLTSHCLSSQCAVGHEYVAHVEKHSSQTDAAQGFGGKFGVQRDRADKVCWTVQLKYIPVAWAALSTAACQTGSVFKTQGVPWGVSL